MRRPWVSILLFLSLLLFAPGGAWGLSTIAREMGIWGVSADPDTTTREIGSQAAGFHWENGPCGYEVATDVGAYVNQNPWSKFDPLGLEKKKPYQVGTKDQHKITRQSMVSVPSRPSMHGDRVGRG